MYIIADSNKPILSMATNSLSRDQQELYLSILDEYEKYRFLSQDEKENLILQITSTRYIDLLCDWAFKHVFGHNKDHLMMLLNDFLPEQIIDIEYDSNEVDLFKGDDKQIIMDVLCHTKDGKFIVEMQKSNSTSFRNRMVYYGTSMVSKQLKPGESYDVLTPVYVICFMDFCLWHDTNQLVYRYQLREQESHELYGRQLSIYLCELPRFAGRRDQPLTPVEEWFEILRNMRTFVKRPQEIDSRFDSIFESCRQNRLEQLEQQQYFRAMITEDEKRGIAESYREEGFREGKAEGKAETRKDDVRKLLAFGMMPEEIAKALQMPQEEVAALAGS